MNVPPTNGPAPIPPLSEEKLATASSQAQQREEKETVTRARAILNGAHLPKPEEVLELARELKDESEFAYARRLLGYARSDRALNSKPELRQPLACEHALCTYKDPNEMLELRLEAALEILREEEPLKDTKHQETLGIAGAIHKRQWEVSGHREKLEGALSYYLGGCEQGVAGDDGYTAINAAFILDCLANQELSAAELPTVILSESAAAKQKRATAIRHDLRDNLPAVTSKYDPRIKKEREKLYWLLATIAEAEFGLENYPAAEQWLTKARALNPAPAQWQLESTAAQLAALARLHSKEGEGLETEPWRVISAFVGNDAVAATHYAGRVGLALSGGGFRASLFHIGVLARLAELDVLRSVEVLSCVSGGSIIGAHYYLEVRDLLEQTPDAQVTPEHYVAIVERVAERFLAGVQRNLRTRVAANWFLNLWMIVNPRYSRTHRLGELFEKELYQRVGEDGHRPRTEAKSNELFIDELKIKPASGPAKFNPKNHNWGRTAKAPILILNATALNTGHTWQFTTSYMGEPPGAIDPEVDGNERLRRMYYNQAPLGYRKVRFGHAVAASACVPGLFEPLSMPGLYPERTVRLVDGGVHDNQGVGSLLEQGATTLLVSDASGQMESQPNPGIGIIGVPLRANGILQARVREAEYHDLSARRRARLLRGLMFLHLKKDLEVEPRDWVDCPVPYDEKAQVRVKRQNQGLLASFGIKKTLQEKLAALRTDLDSFSEAEAFALMTSGYRMAEVEFAADIKTNFPRPELPKRSWKFLEAEPFMVNDAANLRGEQDLDKLLRVGGKLAGKIWMLSPSLQVIGAIAGVGLGVAAIWAAFRWSGHPLVTVGSVGWFFATLILSAVMGPLVMRVVDLRATVRRVLIGLALTVVGFFAAWIHLLIFDPLFLSRGKVRKLQSD